MKEGKLKKSALTDSVIFKGDDNKYYEQIGGKIVDITDEMPFEIPDTWAWVRIGILFAHNNGKQLNKSNSSGRFMEYITTSNLDTLKIKLFFHKKTVLAKLIFYSLLTQFNLHPQFVKAVMWVEHVFGNMIFLLCFKIIYIN